MEPNTRRPAYKLETEWSLLRPKTSTLRLDVDVSALQLPSTVVGTLHWQEKAIEVRGRKRRFSVIRLSAKGLLSKYVYHSVR